MEEKSEPRILAFLCQWCGYQGADMAGTSRLKYPPSIVSILVPCSGRIKMAHVLEALTRFEGVLIAGCHVPSDCHYVNGNFKCLNRVTLLKKILDQMGIDPARVRLEWISATEGKKFARVVGQFTQELKELGTLNLAHTNKNDSISLPGVKENE